MSKNVIFKYNLIRNQRFGEDSKAEIMLGVFLLKIGEVG